MCCPTDCNPNWCGGPLPCSDCRPEFVYKKKESKVIISATAIWFFICATIFSTAIYLMDGGPGAMFPFAIFAFLMALRNLD